MSTNIYSIKINNPVVYTECIESILSDNGYKSIGSDMNEFRFCPWLIAYKHPETGEYIVDNINEGFYNRLKEKPDINVIESKLVKDFIDSIQENKKPTYSLF